MRLQPPIRWIEASAEARSNFSTTFDCVDMRSATSTTLEVGGFDIIVDMLGRVCGTPQAHPAWEPFSMEKRDERLDR